MPSAAVKRLHGLALDFTPSRASDVIQGYPIDGLSELVPEGLVPARAFELQSLLQRSLGAWEPVVGCHNDLTPANCIIDGDRTYLIDWEWSGPFDVVHDLSKLVLLCELDEFGADEVLELYFGAGNVTPLHRARMKLWFLHTISREALWCLAVVRSDRPVGEGEPGDPNPEYDYLKEGEQLAAKFLAKLAAPETAELMAQLTAALSADASAAVLS